MTLAKRVEARIRELDHEVVSKCYPGGAYPKQKADDRQLLEDCLGTMRVGATILATILAKVREQRQ